VAYQLLALKEAIEASSRWHARSDAMDWERAFFRAALPINVTVK